MMRSDEIIVKFFNARVQEVTGRDAVPAQVMVTDSIVGSEGNYDADAVITVRPPDLSTVMVRPPAVQASSIVTTVEVTYTVTDMIAGEDNEITVDLPANWEAAYANDGGDGKADFGRFDDSIDLDGDSTATPPEDEMTMVTSLPADTTPSMKSKASYVTVDI